MSDGGNAPGPGDPAAGAATTAFPLMITSGGVPLAARVHRRAGTSLFERQPAVVVTGSWLNVKEQMADLYARALAARGLTAVTFDFAGWGQSGGELRHVELPSRKIADIAAVAASVADLSFVQPGGVGHVGVCATAQYAMAAIAQGAPIASFASVAGWFHDTASVAPFYGGGASVTARVQRAEAATERYLREGEVVTVPAYGPGDERAAMTLEMDYYANPSRGAVPSWPNEMAEMSWLPWLTFDGISPADAVTVPTLLVHSDGCVFPETVRSLERRLQGPVATEWGKGTQTDFYDQPEQVAFATDALVAHFTATLGPTTPAPPTTSTREVPR
jgi:fermentation-respiration switch protein FrsA (DUF1100 family)